MEPLEKITFGAVFAAVIFLAAGLLQVAYGLRFFPN